MSIKIDKELCIGCGSCAALCPGTFKMNEENGKAEVVSEADPDCAQKAAESCPTQAIIAS